MRAAVERPAMHMRTLKGHCRTALALAITVAVNVAWQLQLYGAAAAGTVIHMGLGAGTRIIATDAGALHVASPATVAGSTTLPHTALPSHGDSLSSDGADHDRQLAKELVSLMEREEKSLALTKQNVAQSIHDSQRRLHELGGAAVKTPAELIRMNLAVRRLEEKRKMLMDEMQANTDRLLELNDRDGIDIDGTVAHAHARIPSRRSLRHTRSLFPTHAYAAAEFRRNRGNAAPTYTASSSASGPAMVELFEDEILDVDRDHDSIYQATPRPDPQPDFQAIDTDSDDIDTDAASAVAISRARAQASSRDGDSSSGSPADPDVDIDGTPDEHSMRSHALSPSLPRLLSFPMGSEGVLDCVCRVRTHRSQPDLAQSAESSAAWTGSHNNRRPLSTAVYTAEHVLDAVDKSLLWNSAPKDGAVPPVLGLRCFEACQEHKCHKVYREAGFDAFHSCLLSCVQLCYRGDDAAMKLAESALQAQAKINSQVKKDLTDATLE